MEDLSKFSDLEFRKWLAKRLVVDQALTPDNPLYEPLYANDSGDPIELIYQDIEMSEVESLNFLSGFRGSGKTTELNRLTQKLREKSYVVVYANALDYILPSEPVDISDFLMVLAGSFSDALENQLGIKLEAEGYWARLVNWLRTTEVKLDGFDAKVGIPKTDQGLNFKASLREVPTFRQKVRESMAARIGELRKEVHEFFTIGLKKVRNHAGGDVNPVFIFDQLEQLRDTLSTEGSVAESVSMLIANHRSDLKVPSYHMVFTLPPWLKFKLADLTKVRLLYNVKLWNNDEQRTLHAAGWKTMHQLVERRFTPEGMARYFGELHGKGTSSLVDKLIEAAGGHFRDVILLLRETLLRATTLPVTKPIITAAISNLRSSFLPIPAADAKWLHEIGQKRDSILQDRTPESVQRMTLFLDTHCALILKNGEEWYDVHPIIREEVAEIVKRDQLSTPA